MKKFKLIKKFPNSPELGTVIFKGNSSDPNPELYGDDKNKCFFNSKNVENYPEFWEEVKEPLFTTYDGLEIFAIGVPIYHVFNDLTPEEDAGYDAKWKIISTTFNIQNNGNEYHKIFAEKENAEKYIRDNEKKYSLNDIKETVKKLRCFGTTLIEYLENEKSEK